jgi:hypothetical protein
MAIELIPSQGSNLAVKIGSPLAFALVDGITTLSFSGGEKETINGTAISDTAPRGVGGFPSVMVGEGECNYDPNDPVHAALEAAQAAGTKLLFRVTLNAETPVVRYFDAEVTAFGNFSLAQNSIVSCPIRLVLDGGRRATESI